MMIPGEGSIHLNSLMNIQETAYLEHVHVHPLLKEIKVQYSSKRIVQGVNRGRILCCPDL